MTTGSYHDAQQHRLSYYSFLGDALFYIAFELVWSSLPANSGKAEQMSELQNVYQQMLTQ